MHAATCGGDVLSPLVTRHRVQTFFLSRPPLDFGRILDSIAILRLVNPRTPLRFAGGRRLLTDEQAAEAIAVGIDAGIQGPLLTTPGKDYADDRQLALAAGYEVVQS